MLNIKNIGSNAIKILLSVLLLTLASCETSQDDGKMTQTAKVYLTQNKLREAGLELKNALQANPGNAEARYYLGVINLEIGNFLSAEKEFKRAVDLGWDEESSTLGLYKSKILSKQYGEVIKDNGIKEVYSTSTKADLMALQAFAFAGNNELERAKSVLNEASSVDENAVQVLITTAQLMLVDQEFEGAKVYLLKAEKNNAGNKELMLISAMASIKLNDNKTAEGLYSQVVEMDPPQIISYHGRLARLGLTRLLILKREFDAARNIMDPVLNRGINDPESEFLGGLLAFQSNEHELAKERLLKVLKVAPGHPQTQLLLGSLNYSQKEYEQAAYYLSKYLEVAPENIAARKLLGRTYMLLGQNKDALGVLEGVDGDDGKDTELMALLGLSNIKSGNVAVGVEELEKAVSMAPENDSLRSELAKAYIASGETDNAIKELNQVLSKSGAQTKTEILMTAAYIKAGDFDKAIVQALSLLSKSPDDASIVTFVGNVFARSGDNIEARKYFNRSLEIAPDNILALMLLAGLEEAEGNFGSAEKLYEKAITNDQENIGPMIALARLAEKQKDEEAMLEWLEKARKVSPTDLRSRAILAEYYLKNRTLSTAEDIIKESLAISPSNPPILSLQARLLISQRRYTEAVSVLQQLVTRVPDSVFARTLLGEAFYNIDQLDDARKQLNIVLDKQSYYVPALLIMSTVEQKAKHYSSALEYANKIIKTKPDIYLGYEEAGDVYMADAQFEKALSSYRDATERKASSTLTIKSANAAIRSGQQQTANQILRDGASLYPDNVVIYQLLGNNYLNLNQDDKAIESFEKVLSLKSDHFSALNNLAWLYHKNGIPGALAKAEQAYNLVPEDPSVQDTYGWILIQENKVDKGVRIMEQAMKSLSGVPVVRYHYAAGLHKAGNKQKARTILEELLNSNQQFDGRAEAEAMLAE